MSILAALNSAYERLALKDKVPSFGFSNQKISYLISLNPDGSVAGHPWDIRDLSGKKPVAVQKQVPQPPKRASGIMPCFLWDKTSYVLGVTAGEGKRLVAEHQAFVDYHVKAFTDTKDEGLQAFLAFLKQWKPESFAQQNWPDEIKNGILDENVIFALESERQQDMYLHHRPAAQVIWSRLCSEGEKTEGVCLVTGNHAPIARLHPSIKGVWDAQSAGASIISYNKDAFASYGHEQGDNAPISEAAAFGYTTALNKFLEKGSHNRIQIGDASTVFWADASDAENTETAEAIFASLFGAEIDEEQQEKTHLRPLLEQIRNGQRLDAIVPNLAKGVRFYVLGLAPNASRLSIRFWMEDTFGTLMENYQRFLSDIRVNPADRNDNIALWQYLLETAVLGKRENVPPTLAGEWMRAILTGTNYPYTLLATVLMRIRADGDVNARRVAILKSILVRNLKMKGVPVAFDPENRNKGYLLGRLFALYEQVQRAALGDKVNATIKDKFYGSASAQPRKVFALLESGSANHLSKIGKQNMGRKVNLEKQIAAIMGLMTPGEDPFPASLSAEQQALFGLGYYHQRSEFFISSTTTVTEKEAA